MRKTLIFLAAFVFVNNAAAQRLQRYNVDPSSITVSGISSGAAMATQFHFSHSTQIVGAGIVAGVPNYCGIGGLAAANLCMSNPSSVNVNFLITQTNGLAASNLIDPVANIRGDRVFIFHGTQDSTILPASGRNVQTMYNHYGANILTEFSIPAEHGWPTHNFGAPCSASSANNAFMNNCGYRGAFNMLNYLYGGLTSPADNAGNLGNLLNFDQAEFFALDPSLSSMSRSGFIYVPTACQGGGRCRLHISFHGCMQSSGNIGNIYATRAGFMEVAEVNNIIVLFPQISAIAVNPAACWDWFGYLNTLFATRQGNQVLATHRMMTRIVHG
ncbi:uncharacterized protein LOC119080854 [Bradysia coprophila]|uniref:uncharacterized protein LOC119080854 n=1 Tax=Bradysia coprophila TaxID=38358 RepID=UPI00187D9EFC|nr:uncharacterized protein LOC119080854 [Bradysia coprophila]